MDGLVVTEGVDCGDDDNNDISEEGFGAFGFGVGSGLDLLLVGSSMTMVSSRESIFFRLLRRGSNDKALLLCSSVFGVEVEFDVPLPLLAAAAVVLLL